MDISAVITQIRTYCPCFNNRVAGSADFAKGLHTEVALSLPACYVYPIGDDTSENQSMGSSLRQQVEERIAVVIELDNTDDRRGQGAAGQIEAFKYDIFKAILNWNPFLKIDYSDTFSRANQGLRYAGGRMVDFDRARLFWQMEFVILSTISEADGFIYTGEQLTDIMLVPTNFPPVQVGIHFPIVLSGCPAFKITGSGRIS